MMFPLFLHHGICTLTTRDATRLLQSCFVYDKANTRLVKVYTLDQSLMQSRKGERTL